MLNDLSLIETTGIQPFGLNKTLNLIDLSLIESTGIQPFGLNKTLNLINLLVELINLFYSNELAFLLIEIKQEFN